MSLSMDVTVHDGVARIGLAGEMDLSTKPQIQAAIASQVSDATP